MTKAYLSGIIRHYKITGSPKIALRNLNDNYEELVKDVKRYFELFYQPKYRDSKEQIEQSVLFDKLTKVGVENE